MNQSPTPASEPPLGFDLLLASTLFIFSRAAGSSDACWSLAIQQHLQLLLDHPECPPGLLKKNLAALQRQWLDKRQWLAKSQWRDKGQRLDNDTYAAAQPLH